MADLKEQAAALAETRGTMEQMTLMLAGRRWNANGIISWGADITPRKPQARGPFYFSLKKLAWAWHEEGQVPPNEIKELLATCSRNLWFEDLYGMAPL